MGNAGKPYDCTTCDTHRQNKYLKINPLDKHLIQKIKYHTRTGEIYSDDAQINDDLNNTLNLNYEGPDFSLCLNRRNVLEVCLEKMNKQRKDRPEDWNQSFLRKMLGYYESKDNEGKYKEYSGIIIWYLKARLKSDC